MRRYILAITGATGVVIGLRLLEVLAESSEVHLIITETAREIIKVETGLNLDDDQGGSTVQEKFGEKVTIYSDDDLWAPMASGSFLSSGMVIAPCSMKTLSGIAHGYANSLVERTADVMIKEGRPLILCPRETPFSVIHLENMLKLARAGVRIVPPVIGFYHRPKTVEEMIDFVVGKILDQLGVGHSLFRRWG